jgi:hypothetical protein
MAKTVLTNIRNNSFEPLTIEAGTYVVWRNLDPHPHSAETVRSADKYFNAGALLPGETSSPVLFSNPDKYDYLCRFHHGMTGTVTVTATHGHVAPTPGGAHGHGNGGGHGHLKHFHGFVTGGRAAKRMFLTHTPVLADPRHHYQIILQASLPDPKQAAAYDAVRASAYGDGKVQTFHDHLDLGEIGSGKITTLPEADLRYYPNDSEGVLGETSIPGLEEKVVVRIDKVLHFHQFALDADYPDSLTYLIYGDADDVFIDHYIDRAPSFHSVAKLAARPAWHKEGTVGKFSVPSKPIQDVSPKIIRRVAYVDNAFHLFWLPPPGVYPLPTDPLRSRTGAPPIHKVNVEGGAAGEIAIGRFLHFDVRLLNYGVLIV